MDEPVQRLLHQPRRRLLLFFLLLLLLLRFGHFAWRERGSSLAPSGARLIYWQAYILRWRHRTGTCPLLEL